MTLNAPGRAVTWSGVFYRMSFAVFQRCAAIAGSLTASVCQPQTRQLARYGNLVLPVGKISPWRFPQLGQGPSLGSSVVFTREVYGGLAAPERRRYSRAPCSLANADPDPVLSTEAGPRNHSQNRPTGCHQAAGVVLELGEDFRAFLHHHDLPQRVL